MAPKRKSLYLIDGHALAYRTYFALTAMGGDASRWITKTGEPTAGTYGFVSVLLKILEQDKPDYLAISFDVGRTFRDDLFPSYKGTREKMPDELSVQIDRINEVVAAFNIPILTADGFEADDVLGTVAQRAAREGVDVKIVTGDRDLLQLADEHITISLSGQKLSEAIDYGPAEVQARFGLTPTQYITYKALVGDKSDNIPGVSGIGEKSATDLVAKYENLDGIYAHLDEIAPRFRGKLEAGRDAAYLSLKLSPPSSATCRSSSTWRSAWRATTTASACSSMFRVLEFNSLMRRLPPLPGSEPAPAEAEPAAEGGAAPAPAGQMALFEQPAASATPVSVRIPEGPTKTTIVSDAAGLKALAAVLKTAAFITFDVETTAPDAINSESGGHRAVGEGRRGLLHPGGPPGRGRGAAVGGKSGGGAQAVHDQQEDSQVRPQHQVRLHRGAARYGLDVTPLSLRHDAGRVATDPASHSLGLKKLSFVRLGIEMTEIKELIGSRQEADHHGAGADRRLRAVRRRRRGHDHAPPAHPGSRDGREGPVSSCSSRWRCRWCRSWRRWS